MATLPTLTRTIDDDFVNTWYEIRDTVTDNIMSARVLFAAMQYHGCMKTQVGGEYVTRTVGYGKKTTQRFAKGTVLTQSEPKLDTMGIWNWRNFAVDITRSLIDDQKNAGKFKIKDYVTRRIENAKESIIEDLETYLMQWGAAYASPLQINGLNDIAPHVSAWGVGTLLTDGVNYPAEASATYATGTSNGGITRVETWWRAWAAENAQTENMTSKLLTTHAPYAVNLVSDMEHLYQCISANQEPVNLYLCDQALYESYADECSNKQQIVINGFTKVAQDLGFDAFTFHGGTISWTNKLASTRDMYFLNMNRLEFVYDPNYWMTMGSWLQSPNQLERVAYITAISTGLLTDQPRRHGVANWSS